MRIVLCYTLLIVSHFRVNTEVVMQIQRNSPALPATAVLRLSPNRPQSAAGGSSGQETLIAAVRFPPRTSQVQPLAALLPDVLSAYGLQPAAPPELFASESFEAVA